MTTSRNPCRCNSSRFQMMSGVPPTGRRGFGMVFVSGLSLVPSPAARSIAFIAERTAHAKEIDRMPTVSYSRQGPAHEPLNRPSLQFRHIGGQVCTKGLQLGILLEIAFHVTQDSWDIR